MLAFAMTFNRERCIPPDDPDSVARTAEADQISALMAEPHTLALRTYLLAHNRPGNTFSVTNGLAQKFGWDRKRLANARERLLDLGHLVLVRKAYTGSPAVYRLSITHILAVRM